MSHRAPGAEARVSLFEACLAGAAIVTVLVGCKKSDNDPDRPLPSATVPVTSPPSTVAPPAQVNPEPKPAPTPAQTAAPRPAATATSTVTRPTQTPPAAPQIPGIDPSLLDAGLPTSLPTSLPTAQDAGTTPAPTTAPTATTPPAVVDAGPPPPNQIQTSNCITKCQGVLTACLTAPQGDGGVFGNTKPCADAFDACRAACTGQ